ncbi:MAG: glycosyltransferase family 4 protein [Spiribacter salinus]|uniref:Glycosyltransferase family 4 protein n=1 Tax=Spiribacter salinus TaxID=1335746 RepID=A0A540VS92_9GAMM|nr:MAG: glycosyltransferase family 4 protein [Spiribacter salinus]
MTAAGAEVRLFEGSVTGDAVRLVAPQVAVISSLYPSPGDPVAGVFIRERMGRVAQRLPVTVFSPRPSSPLDPLLRRLRPGYRQRPSSLWEDENAPVHYPAFPAVPALLRRLDGDAMARALLPRLRQLRDAGRLDLIDAHFAYPDGYAAATLGRTLGVPVTITLRGTEARLAGERWARRKVEWAVRNASWVIGVSESLRALALELGAPPERTEVIPNGVDTERFHPVDQARARRALGLGADDRVLVTVGGLCERKGQHRVIEQLPNLLVRFPRLHYVVVGGASGEGDWQARLAEQAHAAGVAERVHLLGKRPPDEIPGILAAADVFVLATRNEGWANVLLEAMACGLPVVATDVGGNREVVCREQLGRIVPFGDGDALRGALEDALERDSDREAIAAHAATQDWSHCAEAVIRRFRWLTEAGQ